MSGRPHRWIVLGPVLALLILSYSFGAPWWEVPPPGQSAQMWSKVDYDRNLTDPFFKADEWSCPDGCADCATCQDGEQRLKHTAKCFSTSHWTEHDVRFSYLKSLDENTLAVLIEESNPEFYDRLRIWIRDGLFTCQYSTGYKGPGKADWIWTTTRQALSLDKKVYRRGDVIKGKIDFECLQEPTNQKYIKKWGRNLRKIQVYGVFKAKVK